MRIVKSGSWGWYLLEHEGEYYMDIRVQLGIVDTSCQYQLKAREVKGYHKYGDEFIDKVANNNQCRNNECSEGIPKEICRLMHETIANR